jgi:hypothetical protein
MTAVPLAVIPEGRRHQELRRALDRARAERLNRHHALLPALLCVVWVLLGCLLVGLDFHLTDPDRAEAAFLAGILVGNGGPAWTVIISHWLAERRYARRCLTSA